MVTTYHLPTATTRIDVEHNAGEPFGIRIPILDATNSPVDIPAGTESSWAGLAQVRRNAYAATALHEWTTGGATPNAVIEPGPAAHIVLTASADDTAAWQDWPDYTCTWDVWVTEPATGADPPDPSRLADGGFRVRPRTSR